MKDEEQDLLSIQGRCEIGSIALHLRKVGVAHLLTDKLG